jgi:putative ABC transport system ATP-binding protein
MALLELRDAAKVYGEGDTAVYALRGVTLALERGEVVLIEGPSGSGKTTLLSIMGCILRPTTGQVIVDGLDATALSERQFPELRANYFGYVFQHYHLFNALTAAENVEMTLRLKFGDFPRPREEAARLLQMVGLGARLRHKPGTLSGGERQRVAIARALAGDPPLILADEPTAALDTENALSVVGLLQQLAREASRTVVLVSHDQRLEAYADRTVRVQDGRIKEIRNRGQAWTETPAH